MRYLIDRGAAMSFKEFRGLAQLQAEDSFSETIRNKEDELSSCAQEISELESRVDELSDLLRKAGICPVTGLPQTPGEGM